MIDAPVANIENFNPLRFVFETAKTSEIIEIYLLLKLA